MDLLKSYRDDICLPESSRKVRCMVWVLVRRSSTESSIRDEQKYDCEISEQIKQIYFLGVLAWHCKKTKL